MEQKYMWDLTKYCKDIKSCKDEMKQIESEIENLKVFKGNLDKPEKLCEFFKKRYELISRLDVCYVYAFATLDTNAKLSNYQLLSQEIVALESKLSSELAFADPEITKNKENLESFKNLPMFKDWTKVLDSYILEADHTLSEKEEKLLAEVEKFASGFKDIQKSCFNADIKYEDALDENGNPHHLNAGSIASFMTNPDRVLRQNVAQKEKEATEKYSNCMAQTFINYINSKVTFAKIRNYNSVQEVSFSKFKLSPKIYENVVEHTLKNYHILEDYLKAKKKILGLDEMFSYDMNIGLEKQPKKYTFEEGVEIVKKALSILGEDYIKMIDRAVDERWIDVYPRENKKAGGYCWGIYTKTDIILLNWTDDIGSVFTLAHELGHAIHHHILYSNQKIQNTHIPVFMAEVASTFNEVLLFDYLTKNLQNKDEKIVLLERELKEIAGIIFRQIEFSQFEDFCYKTVESGGVLTKEILENKWKEVRIKPYEKIINTTLMNLSTWQNIWHFYNLSYYVWQYNIAYLISNHFAKAVLSKQPNALENYFNFLKGSATLYPTEFLQKLGIDILDQNFYAQSFKNFEKIKDEFISLV